MCFAAMSGESVPYNYDGGDGVGSWEWTVPDKVSNLARIRVESLDNPVTVPVTDMNTSAASAANFNILGGITEVTVVADGDAFESKRFTYRQLTNTLGRFPDLRVMVAHMGGWPENLSFLDALLDRYPNSYLDTSATKWVARELSHQPAAARQLHQQ